jgi:5'-nucleotidase
MVQVMMKNPELNNSAINVNVPALPPDEIKGVMVVPQGKGNIVEHFEKRIDPRENTYYWISGESQKEPETKDTDVTSLAQGFITITPIQSDLTRYDLLDDLKKIISTQSVK